MVFFLAPTPRRQRQWLARYAVPCAWRCRWESPRSVSVATLVLVEGNRVPPRRVTPCERRGGTCLARNGLSISTCRTEERIRQNRPFTFVAYDMYLADRYPESRLTFSLCEEPYMCCIEEPCKSLLDGSVRMLQLTPARVGNTCRATARGRPMVLRPNVVSKTIPQREPQRNLPA